MISPPRPSWNPFKSNPLDLSKGTYHWFNPRPTGQVWPRWCLEYASDVYAKIFRAKISIRCYPFQAFAVTVTRFATNWTFTVTRFATTEPVSHQICNKTCELKPSTVWISYKCAFNSFHSQCLRPVHRHGSGERETWSVQPADELWVIHHVSYIIC